MAIYNEIPHPLSDQKKKKNVGVICVWVSLTAFGLYVQVDPEPLHMNETKSKLKHAPTEAKEARRQYAAVPTS